MEFKKRQKILFAITMLLTIFYIVWRIFFTLPFQYGIVSSFIGISLLLVEVANIGIDGWKEKRQEMIKPKLAEEEFPDIDVFIATYNEPAFILKKTI